MTRVDLSLYWTGSCRHPECSTMRGGSWRLKDFPMYAAVIDRCGELSVFDPGYSPGFLSATEPFPERLYRWMTPAACPADTALAARLHAQGRLDQVTQVIVSHFHADHIAGLRDFPKARIVCSRAAWLDFQRREGWAAVTAGYLKALAPDDLRARITFVEDLPKRDLQGAATPLEAGYDLFGDSGVLLTHLPGHSKGQVGALLQGRDGATRFLIADAAWSATALEKDLPPPWIVRQVLGRPRVYIDTWRRLRQMAQLDRDLRMIPSHCPRAAQRENAVDV